ncbi:hypothetical protein, partial [Microvirga tunisiensis]|uniref:hypothetical protein n=1 Tax=Microvirga tunisiensis TaxID=2108360 RepID=UPI001AEDC10B
MSKDNPLRPRSRRSPERILSDAELQRYGLRRLSITHIFGLIGRACLTDTRRDSLSSTSSSATGVSWAGFSLFS